MPRYHISADERYPDWSVSDEAECGIELTAEEFADYRHVVDQYEAWQKRLDAAWSQTVEARELQDARDFKAGKLTESDLRARWPIDHSGPADAKSDMLRWADRNIRDIKKLAETLPADNT